MPNDIILACKDCEFSPVCKRAESSGIPETCVMKGRDINLRAQNAVINVKKTLEKRFAQTQPSQTQQTAVVPTRQPDQPIVVTMKMFPACVEPAENSGILMLVRDITGSYSKQVGYFQKNRGYFLGSTVDNIPHELSVTPDFWCYLSTPF